MPRDPAEPDSRRRASERLAEDYYRGRKFVHETLAHCLAVSHRAEHVDHHARLVGQWLTTTHTSRDDRIELPDGVFQLGQLYDGIDVTEGA